MVSHRRFTHEKFSLTTLNTQGEKYEAGSTHSCQDVSRFTLDASHLKMTPEGVLDIGTSAIQTILLVAGPMLGFSLVVGLMISAFQAMTQINEATLTFVPKIVTVFLVVLFGFPWILQTILGFMISVWGQIPEFTN